MSDYKIITAEELPTAIKDEEKRIEETEQVEQKRTFTISDLKRQIEQCDEEITRATERKAELEAKISAVVADLDLKLVEINPIIAK